MSVDRWMDKEKVVYIFNGILFSYKKEGKKKGKKKKGNPVICDNMNELGGHYVKWKKSDWERQMLRGITYMCNLKKKKKIELIETE